MAFCFPAVTKREQQIIQLLVEGLSNKEIAQGLYLQPQTVKSYVHLVLQKPSLQTHSTSTNADPLAYHRP